MPAQQAALEKLLQSFSPADLLAFAEAEECERDLAMFIRKAWNIIDPAPYVHGWHIASIADHLMAVSDGEIRRLLINVSPRCMKSSVVSMLWPAWTWAARPVSPLLGPQVKFLCLSYGLDLALDAARSMRRLIESDWYQKRWGHRVQIAADQDSKNDFGTTAKGARISAGFGGAVLGRGGDIRIIDDPHKPDEVESELVRQGVIRQYDEELAIRVTDPKTSAEVIIMQRLAEDDLSGHILAESDPDLVHLMIPMRFEPERKCYTVLGWEDPREEDGELMWPERFPEAEVAKIETRFGPFAVAGRLQQAPMPRGGALIKSEWWRLWKQDAFPDFSTVLISLDTASTEKEENDESALTAWGAWADENGRPNIMLIDAWEGFMEFSPLLNQTTGMCRRHKADILLVEAKNIGQSIEQEIRRMFGGKEWSTLFSVPKGDKVARLISVQHMWSGDQVVDPKTGMKTWTGGVIWAPDKEWAQLVLDRVGSFPKGKRKGIVDTVSQAIKYLRDNGIILRPQEYDEERLEERRYRRQRGPAYDV